MTEHVNRLVKHLHSGSYITDCAILEEDGGLNDVATGVYLQGLANKTLYLIQVYDPPNTIECFSNDIHIDKKQAIQLRDFLDKIIPLMRDS